MVASEKMQRNGRVVSGSQELRVDIMTREFPPHVYGGAGVHVEQLSVALAQLGTVDVRVRGFGDDLAASYATGYTPDVRLAEANAALSTLSTNVAMVPDVAGADLVHSHTWYANFAGHVASQLHGIPHIMTSHSLEPLRPWKAEQLGGGYALSSWVEAQAVQSAQAVIAVSAAMRADILRCYPQVPSDKVRVVHNGIDPDRYRPTDGAAAMQAVGLDPDRPSIMFVGRITRQKGLPHLLRAVAQLPRDTQVLLCAGAPDTPQIAQEVQQLVRDLNATHEHVVWVDRHLGATELIQLLSAATVFVCPSVYEPLGIVNLEAMACGTAVVATRTGGIPEVVDDPTTGWLVPISQVDDGSGAPHDREVFEADLAQALGQAIADPAECARRGEAGREVVCADFSWHSVAAHTAKIYHDVLTECGVQKP